MKVLLALTVLCSTQFTWASEPAQIKNFTGTYTGLAFSDASPSGISEIEIKIDGDKISSRMATGSKISEETQNVALTPMSEEQVAAAGLFKPEFVKNWVAFSTGGAKPYYLFNVDKTNVDVASLVIQFASDSLVGVGQSQIYGQPIMELYSASAVKKGAIDDLAKKLKGQLPRLASGGKVPEIK